MTEHSNENNTNNISPVSVNNIASSFIPSRMASSVSTTNPSLFTKQLSFSLENIILSNMNTLTPTDISTLQSIVVYINFMGNYILPKLVAKEPALLKISELMAVLYQSNENLANAIESFKN